MIGIVTALPEEFEALCRHLGPARPLAGAPSLFAVGPALVARSGVGKVNAAVGATHLCAQGARLLLTTGAAGALAPELEPGDVVVATSFCFHDVDLTALGEPPYRMLGMPLAYPADPQAQDRLEAACRSLGLRVVRGAFATGDQFVAGPARSRAAATGAACVEMEGAAVAQAGYLHGVPVAGLRTVSDRADGKAPADFGRFLAEAAERAARAVAAFLTQS